MKDGFDGMPALPLPGPGARPFVLRDCAANPMLRHAREWFAARGVETTLLIPVLGTGRLAGWFALFSRETRDYGDEELKRAENLGQQLKLAIELARAAAEERESAVLAERSRIARELHDTLAQSFTTILIQLEAAKDLPNGEKREAFVPLARARAVARESLAEARRAVWAMRPRALDESDLATALDRLVRELSASSSLALAFAVRGAPQPLPIRMETDLLRVAQEALTNALRHSRASSVRVALTFAEADVTVMVEDDGRGLARQDARGEGGFGLIGMRERVEGLGGKLLISSRPGRGTRIQAKVPITKP